MTFVQVMEKKSILECLLFFMPRLPRMSFPDETWQALTTFVILCHQFFLNFLDFIVHGGMIRAKSHMGTYQHFCHEYK